MNERNTDTLIDELVSGLEPVRPLRFARGIGLAAIGFLVAAMLAVLRYGVRPDLLGGRPDAMFVLSGGVFLLLGVACTAAVVSMSSPRVGMGRNGWEWAAATASMLPLAALVALTGDGSAWAASEPDHGWICIVWSIGLGLILGTILTLWLRRGAPASPKRAGLLTGIAAGCAGVVAFTVACPITSLMHVGLWHGMAVTVSALAGRLIVPPLVRW